MINSPRHTQQKVWNLIRNDIVTEMLKRGEKEDDLPDADQCSTRFETIRKPYKKAKDFNRNSGGSPKTSKFYVQLDEILGSMANIEPDVTISSCGEIVRKKTSEDEV